jgi:hypothetical protein
MIPNEENGRQWLFAGWHGKFMLVPAETVLNMQVEMKG